MKERLEIAEKSLLLSIPYLIILSLAYYWGYWGYFDIDAISYYGVQDLIKGFAYAMPGVILLGITLLIGNKLVDFILDRLRNTFNKISFSTITGVFFSALFVLYISGVFPDEAGDWIEPTVMSMIALTIFEVIFKIIEKDWSWAAGNAFAFFILKWFAIYGIISFYASYTYGKHEAKNISDGKYFSYSKLLNTNDSTKNAFKYLGKAGDYYFFISPDNKERQIISIQKIPNLILYNYDKNDTASIHAYRILVEKRTLHKKMASPTR